MIALYFYYWKLFFCFLKAKEVSAFWQFFCLSIENRKYKFNDMMTLKVKKEFYIFYKWNKLMLSKTLNQFFWLFYLQNNNFSNAKDEIYNHKTKLIIQSEVDLDQLFYFDEDTISEEIFMMHRCLSRLLEIQTKAYLSLPHLTY